MSEGFEAIARQFAERCAQDLATVEQALTKGPDQETQSLRTVVHRLAGLAATFGYAELGDLSRSIDIALIEGRYPARAELQALATALAKIP